MTFGFRPALVAALMISAGSAIAAESSFSDAQKKEIGEVVRQYLLENPELLLEVSQELEKRQQQAENKKREEALKTSAAELFHSPHDLVVGNPNGDVVMVEFFDYNCGWCKKGLPEVMSLIEKDKNLKLVLKEFPIFGGDSDYAAMAALASKNRKSIGNFMSPSSDTRKGDEGGGRRDRQGHGTGPRQAQGRHERA